MQCRFLQHGIQVYYGGLIKPCCAFTADQEYRSQHHISQVDLGTWHRSGIIHRLRQELSQDTWPKECARCEHIESQGRGDSIRLSGDQAYGHYQDDDITLEIRPGTTCNFACQTCWPQASSRVANYYRRAGIDFQAELDQDWSFEMIQPVLSRVRDIIILGGEPFYDKKCLQLLRWLEQQQHHPRITMFTNGSVIDWQFLQQYRDRITLVFSLDALGKPAEYIRVGTEWHTVWANFQTCAAYANVELRVNITTSPYNYIYLGDLLRELTQDWPAVVSWGIASQNQNSRFMNESAIPIAGRGTVVQSLQRALDVLHAGNIEHYQKVNAINAVQSIIDNLESMPYDQQAHRRLLDFIVMMDRIKNLEIQQYCPEVADYLGVSAARLERDSPTFLISDITDNRA